MSTTLAGEFNTLLSALFIYFDDKKQQQQQHGHIFTKISRSTCIYVVLKNTKGVFCYSIQCIIAPVVELKNTNVMLVRSSNTVLQIMSICRAEVDK